MVLIYFSIILHVGIRYNTRCIKNSKAYKRKKLMRNQMSFYTFGKKNYKIKYLKQ